MAAVFGLAKNNLTVIGADEKSLPFNMYSRHLKSHYKLKSFKSSDFHYNLLSIIRKERPDVLIPIGGTRHVSLHKEEFLKYTNVLVPDYESFCTSYDKKKTYKICCQAGIEMPKHFSDYEAELILKTGTNNRLVIKPDFDIGGSRGLKIVNNINELNSAKKDIQNNFGNYIIEEFIPGASRTRTLQLLFNKNNNLISHFILKKLHQWPITGGNTAYAVSTHEKELLTFVLPFFEKCKWEGPAGVQLIIDERDGRPKLIEINPRFTGSLAFAIQCGVNLPFAACLAALNKNDTNSYYYDAGKFYIHLSFYLKAIIKEFGITEKKFDLLMQMFKELFQKKVGVMIDSKDFPVYLAKAFAELKN